MYLLTRRVSSTFIVAFVIISIIVVLFDVYEIVRFLRHYELFKTSHWELSQKISALYIILTVACIVLLCTAVNTQCPIYLLFWLIVGALAFILRVFLLFLMSERVYGHEMKSEVGLLVVHGILWLSILFFYCHMNPIDLLEPQVTTVTTIEAPIEHFTVVPAMTSIPVVYDHGPTHYYETGPEVTHVYETHHY